MEEFLYKEIDIENYSDLLQELIDYCKKNVVLNNSSYNLFNVVDLAVKCPKVFKWFSLNKMLVRECAIITVFEDLKNAIHIDTRTDNNKLALNFGIKIPNESYTVLYKVKSGTPKTNYLENNVSWIGFDDCQVEEIARFNLEKPTIFNTSVPHLVVNNSRDLRISLSFRFYQDPWDLVR